MENLLQPIVNGILLGGLYAVIAIGLSIIMGIVKIMNFAHGDLMILGSYMSLVTVSWLGIHPLLSLIIVAPLMYGMGYLIQSLLINRVLGMGEEPPLIVAFGLSIILQNILLLTFTPDARTLISGLNLITIPISKNLNIPLNYLIDFLIGIAVFFCLYYFFHRSYLGRAIRAASGDAAAAELIGVNTHTIYAKAMGIAMTTAAVAGVLVGMTFTFYPHSGSQFLFIAFGVAIIGGLGSMRGTLAAGILLAVAQLLGAHFFGPGYQMVTGHIILLVVLLVRPQGLFGTV